MALQRAVEEVDDARCEQLEVGDRRAAWYGGTWVAPSSVSIQRGAVRLARSHAIDAGYGSYSSPVSITCRIGVPVSRTCGLFALLEVARHRDHRAHPRVAAALEEPDAERDHLAVGVPRDRDALPGRPAPPIGIAVDPARASA